MRPERLDRCCMRPTDKEQTHAGARLQHEQTRTSVRKGMIWTRGEYRVTQGARVTGYYKVYSSQGSSAPLPRLASG